MWYERMTMINFEKNNVEVRKFALEDVKSVESLIHRNFREENIKDYGQESMDEMKVLVDERHYRMKKIREEVQLNEHW